MAVNVIKYEWDIGEERPGAEIINLNFHVWLGRHKNNRHVTIDLFKCYETDETQVISEEISLKQLVCLRDFLNTIPFLDEEENEDIQPEIFDVKESLKDLTTLTCKHGNDYHATCADCDDETYHETQDAIATKLGESK